jgi:hypothetical protein
LSLAGIRQAWSEGRICVRAAAPDADRPVLGLNHLIHADDAIELDGTRLVPRTEHYTAKLNKPPSVTSTTKDPLGQADLAPWLARMPEGTVPVGRLDRETTGLLLFTTDGELADAILQPARHTTRSTGCGWTRSSARAIRDGQISALAPHARQARHQSRPDARLEAWLESEAAARRDSPEPSERGIQV